jgi:iron-sulfur cluster repair protein YtfE (RIC family)
MSNFAYAGATPEQLEHPLVREFLAVHAMFRRELNTMLTFSNELLNGEQALTSPDTPARIQALIRVGIQYNQLLHHHHHGESDMLFPVLKEQGLEDPVIDRLLTDHDDIAVLIDAFSATIRQVSALDPAVLNNDLRRLSDALSAHLAYEETHVCPFIARLTGWPPF